MRRAVAWPADAGDLMDVAVDFERSEQLAEYQKVALRLQTAFFFHPDRVDDDLRAEVLDHFSPAQVVELGFKYFWWSTNKPNVTLGTDAPHAEDSLTAYHYGEDGEFIVHAAEG